MRWHWFIWVLGISVLAACGANTSAPSTAPQALPPIMIAISDGSITDPIPAQVRVGDFVVFTGDSADWRISTTTPDVVRVAAGGDQGGYTTNPGAEAIAVGTAVITLAHDTHPTITVSFDVIAR
jgi:hypothetical protein